MSRILAIVGFFLVFLSVTLFFIVDRIFLGTGSPIEINLKVLGFPVDQQFVYEAELVYIATREIPFITTDLDFFAGGTIPHEKKLTRFFRPSPDAPDGVELKGISGNLISLGAYRLKVIQIRYSPKGTQESYSVGIEDSFEPSRQWYGESNLGSNGELLVREKTPGTRVFEVDFDTLKKVDAIYDHTPIVLTHIAGIEPSDKVSLDGFLRLDNGVEFDILYNVMVADEWYGVNRTDNFKEEEIEMDVILLPGDDADTECLYDMCTLSVSSGEKRVALSFASWQELVARGTDSSSGLSIIRFDSDGLTVKTNEHGTGTVLFLLGGWRLGDKALLPAVTVFKIGSVLKSE